VKVYLALAALGGVLIGVAGWLGGRAGAIGGGVALAAQLAAVALLRPAMREPTPRFMARWLGGMAIRALAAAALIGVSVARREELPLLAASLGFLGVLLPLLFLETRFLT
jgi:hypothetical protein